MKLRYLFLLILISVHSLLIAQSSLVEENDGLFGQEAYKNAHIGLIISDNTTGKVLYEQNAHQLFIPASVMKLITTATALEILGPEYRFITRLFYTGKINNGVLHGDLVIMGGGDPALGSSYFQEHYFAPHFLESWALMVGEAGIETVTGRIIVENSIYSNEQVSPTWTWEDMGNYYGAGTNALSYRDNMLRVTFQSPASSGLPTQILSIDPEVKELVWQNEVLSSDIQRDRAYVFGSPIDNKRIIRGTIPKNRKAFTIKASNPYPHKTLAEDFNHYLSNAGIQVKGTIAREKMNFSDLHLLVELPSPPLSEIIKIINHESVNLFAEHLVMQLAAERMGEGDRTTGLNLIVDFWAEKGLKMNEVYMEDGSGLSHFNAITPSFVVSLLHYMKKTSTHSKVFFESLPIAGAGTLSAFNASGFHAKSLRLKSGSMKRIRGWAGYITTQSGKDLSVAFFFNHLEGSYSKLINDLEKFFITTVEE